MGFHHNWAFLPLSESTTWWTETTHPPKLGPRGLVTREQMGWSRQRACLPARLTAPGPVCAGLRAALPVKPRLWGPWGWRRTLPPSCPPWTQSWQRSMVGTKPRLPPALVQAGRADARVQAGWGCTAGPSAALGAVLRGERLLSTPTSQQWGRGLVPSGRCFDSGPRHVASVLSQAGVWWGPGWGV